MNKLKADLIIEGDVLKIFALKRGNRCWAKEFWDSLDASDRNKLSPLLKRLADRGIPPKNQEYCKPLRDKIWEIRKGQIRLFFFRLEGNIYITHGIKKKTNRVPPKEIDKAIELMKKFKEEKDYG